MIEPQARRQTPIKAIPALGKAVPPKDLPPLRRGLFCSDKGEWGAFFFASGRTSRPVVGTNCASPAGLALSFTYQFGLRERRISPCFGGSKIFFTKPAQRKLRLFRARNSAIAFWAAKFPNHFSRQVNRQPLCPLVLVDATARGNAAPISGAGGQE